MEDFFFQFFLAFSEYLNFIFDSSKDFLNTIFLLWPNVRWLAWCTVSQNKEIC